MPIHAAQCASGPSDCEIASLPHAKPPHGHTFEMPSRAVHSPAIATGVSSRRPATPGKATGIHRQASAIGIAPSATKKTWASVRASHGTTPR
jgi:hypothetical protein